VGEHNIWVVCQSGPDLFEVLVTGRCIKVDRHTVADSSQPFRLPDDGLRILVTQQYVGKFCHGGKLLPLCLLLFI